jgi:hypothetical protein
MEKRVYGIPHARSIKLCPYTKAWPPFVLPDSNSKDDILYCQAAMR